jgi:hypothetical protein
MSVSVAPTIFDVFNARSLPPEEVAATFVPPIHFRSLCKKTHSLVIGPRGSGKTTLLKMLHPAALEAWRHADADAFRQAIDYTGVFLGIDRNWSEQVKALGHARLESDLHRLLARAAFTAKFHLALVDSMQYRTGQAPPPHAVPHRRVSLPEKREAVIARQIMAVWKLDQTIPSMQAVSFALNRRLNEIWWLASLLTGLPPTEARGRLINYPYLHLDFLQSAIPAIDAYNSVVRERNGRWALLFDELELAPTWLQDLLYGCLRSTDDRFLFKLSISPYLAKSFESGSGAPLPSEGQDYESIHLWYEHKESGYGFCEALLHGMLRQKGFPSAKPETVLDLSHFATDTREWKGKKTAYRADSQLGRMLARLAEKDTTFAEYLNTKGITFRGLASVEGTDRAAILRKARTVAALREYFRGGGREVYDARRQGRRSRKVPAIYGGATSLFAMVEGNPRWFVGIVGQLLQRWRPGSPISRPAQVREVLESAHVFRAMLKTIPCTVDVRGQQGNLVSVLDAIGEYFSAQAIDGPFNPDPPSSFRVDAGVDDAVVHALGQALNAGAIVYAPDPADAGLLTDLHGKRFRLSYILAPIYLTPLTLGTDRALSRILRRKGPTLRRKIEEVGLFTMGPIGSDEE